MWQLPWSRHVSVPSRPVLTIMIDSTSEAPRYESIGKASCSFARLAEPSHRAQAMIASDRPEEREKSNPIFSAAVVLTWHANLTSLSHFLSRSLNNSLIRLEKMMMILKLTGASIEIYRLLLLFLLPAVLYHTLSLHLILCHILRNKLGQQVSAKHTLSLKDYLWLWSTEFVFTS